MSGVDWVWSDEWSSFFQEIVELSIFLSCAVVLSGLVGNSWDSNVDFCKFFEWKSFSRAESFFFFFGLFSEINEKCTQVRQRRQWRWCLRPFRRFRPLRWRVWCNCFWVRTRRVVLDGYCMRVISNHDRADRPFFFTMFRSMNYATVFDEFDRGFAFEGDSENISKFEDQELLGSWITVQILLANSWIVSVWLDHWRLKNVVLLRNEWWSYLQVM